MKIYVVYYTKDCILSGRSVYGSPYQTFHTNILGAHHNIASIKSLGGIVVEIKVVREERPDKDPPQLDISKFNCRVINALDSVFPRAVSKSIARRLRKKRNAHGIGLVGEVVDFQEGDEDKVSYSPKGVSRKNTKRRRKITFGRYLSRYSNLALCDKVIELIQNNFNCGRFELLWGDDAAAIYRNRDLSSSKTGNYSCMANSDYNDHLFKSNVGKLGLLVYKKHDLVHGRTKLYKNDNGTYFLETRSYCTGNYREMFESYFDRNYTEGELCCTLHHKTGESMPYIDATVDGYGFDRLDDYTIKIHSRGEYSAEFTDGSDPSYLACSCCECNSRDMTEVDDEHYCQDCLHERFVEIGGEYVSIDDCVYSEMNEEWFLNTEATCVIVDKYGNNDYVIDEYEEYEGELYYSDIMVYLHDDTRCPEWLATELADGRMCLDDDCYLYNGKYYLTEEAIEYDGETYPPSVCVMIDDEMVPSHLCEEVEGVWTIKELV